ncbi:MAG: iron ABC transporter [Nitrospinae bacterium CG11_big_fil_rev_8_21_14_0_20_45_15]|nr:MAG: iron ABC transporter [Nitrospinae bacterium CG11_big_fil_rev_8_21_14_0_20_45_15]
MTKKHYITTLGIFLIFLLATLAIAPLIGATDINLRNAFSSEIPFKENIDAHILFLARLPRILLAGIAGSALAIAGAVFQALLRNDLAAPFTLGVSSGAAFGAVLSIAMGWTFRIMGIPALSLFAFMGALLAVALVFSLVKVRHNEFQTSTLLLAGVTANFFFAALVMFIHYLSDFTQSFQIIRWLMGGLDITDYATVLSIIPPVAFGFFVLMLIARDLNLISAGVSTALSRGVNVSRIQKTGFIVSSLITGTVVAFTGPIGFVGLIAPHIVRLIVGPDLRLLLPCVMMFGAAFLILCDAVARTLIAPAEIPVGVITAILGGPFFVWLLKRKKNA